MRRPSEYLQHVLCIFTLLNRAKDPVVRIVEAVRQVSQSLSDLTAGDAATEGIQLASGQSEATQHDQ